MVSPDDLAGTNPRTLLTFEERRLAESFRLERDRTRFERSHAALRILLGQRLKLQPDKVKLEFNSHGKPYVSDGPFFNISHSDNCSAIAIAQLPVGIDIERFRPDYPGIEVARTNFHPSEVAWLEQRPSEHRNNAFFRMWVSKEALLKCIGEGLSIPLEDCQLEFEGPAILGIRWNAYRERRFSLFELRIDPEFAAALVLETVPPSHHLSTGDARLVW